MKRAVILLLCLGSSIASAQKPKATSPKAAKAANKSAFEKALAKVKLKQIKLAAVPADPEESVADSHYVGNVVVDRNGHHDPTFVVAANKDVFRVVRKITTIGRVKENVCIAGPVKPIRVKRTRFDVPAGHTFQGDVEVSYDAFVIDEQNTCR